MALVVVRTGALVVLLGGCDVLFEIRDVEPREDARGDAVHDTAGDAAFDAARDCPASYVYAFTTTSRYRQSDTNAAVWVQADACAADAPGLTHLVVLDDSIERDKVQAGLDSVHAFRWFVGLVQRPSAAGPMDMWVSFDGSGPYLSWNVNEPNDSDGSESDHAEQFAVLEEGLTGLIDVAGHDSYRALCECDGHPVTMDAGALVSSYVGTFTAGRPRP